MAFVLAERKLKPKKKASGWKLIIRRSHQNDTMIKSEDIKKILPDDFFPYLLQFKNVR